MGGVRGRKFFFKFNSKNVPNLEEEGGVREGHSYRFNDDKKLFKKVLTNVPNLVVEGVCEGF